MANSFVVADLATTSSYGDKREFLGSLKLGRRTMNREKNSVSLAHLLLLALVSLLMSPRTAYSVPEPVWLGGDPKWGGGTEWCPQPKGEWQCYNYNVSAEDLQLYKFRIDKTWSDDKIQVKVNDILVWDEQVRCDPPDHFSYPNIDITPQLTAGDNNICLVALCPCNCRARVPTNGCILISAGPDDACPHLNLP